MVTHKHTHQIYFLLYIYMYIFLLLAFDWSFDNLKFLNKCGSICLFLYSKIFWYRLPYIIYRNPRSKEYTAILYSRQLSFCFFCIDLDYRLNWSFLYSVKYVIRFICIFLMDTTKILPNIYSYFWSLYFAL